MQRRDAPDRTPARERVSAEAIGAAGAAAGTLWASVAEFLPTSAKAVVGAGLAAVGAWSAVKAWNHKRKEK
jgi:hypothetical protein